MNGSVALLTAVRKRANLAVERGFPLTYRAIESQQWRKLRISNAASDLEIHDPPAPLPTFASGDRLAAMRRSFRQSGNHLSSQFRSSVNTDFWPKVTVGLALPVGASWTLLSTGQSKSPAAKLHMCDLHEILPSVCTRWGVSPKLH